MWCVRMDSADLHVTVPIGAREDVLIWPTHALDSVTRRLIDADSYAPG